MYQSKHTRQKSLPEMHETMRIHVTKVRPTIFNTQTNFQSYQQQTMTNHHVKFQPKDQAMMQPSYILATSNEETSSKVNTIFQLTNSTVQEMKTDRNKVLRSGEHAER